VQASYHYQLHEPARQFIAEEFQSRGPFAELALSEVEGVAMTESKNDSRFVLLNFIAKNVSRETFLAKKPAKSATCGN
jgi:hypothetical protein